jgi:hypothetical protein
MYVADPPKAGRAMYRAAFGYLRAMGKTVACAARVGEVEDRGTALLETDEVIFRGTDAGAKARVPFAKIRAMCVRKGWLAIAHATGTLELELGEAAGDWLARIQSPKSVVEKLGVPAGSRVALVDVDAGLAKDLEARGAKVTGGAPRSEVDIVFFGVEAEADLARVPALVKAMVPSGVMWLVRPKGKMGVPEAAVRAAAHGAGLVDVKVVRFSETHTAEKYVVPVAKRGPAVKTVKKAAKRRAAPKG